MKTGIELITTERDRQVAEEGWTPEHDEQHSEDDLAVAGAMYALPSKFRRLLPNVIDLLWPWAKEWWKPTPNDRVRELVKAGALIAAEIDRLQRNA